MWWYKSATWEAEAGGLLVQASRSGWVTKQGPTPPPNSREAVNLPRGWRLEGYLRPHVYQLQERAS